MLLTDKYADKIYGTITCYDRMIIQGYIPGWSHAEGMTAYMKANNIRIFDFSTFSQPLTEQIWQNVYFRHLLWPNFRNVLPEALSCHGL